MYAGFHTNYPLFVSDFNGTEIFSIGFSKKWSKTSNFINIRPVGAELFHADGQTDVTNLVFTFRNLGDEPKTPTELSCAQTR